MKNCSRPTNSGPATTRPRKPLDQPDPGGAETSPRGPERPLWRDFPYEYETGKLAIDVINGSELLRQWVDDPAALPGDLDALALADEAAWRQERSAFLLYP